MAAYCSFSCEEGNRSCTPNERQCNGDVLQVCSNGVWIYERTCANGCDAENNQCNSENGDSACINNEKRCSGDDLHICSKNTWNFVITCLNGCDAVKKECRAEDVNSPCRDGESHCDGDDLKICIQGKWIQQTCAVGCDPEKAACDNECDPGGSDKNCQAACKSDGKEGYYWAGDRVETVACDIGESCKANGNQVACLKDEDSNCSTGQRRCDGDNLKVCIHGEWIEQRCDGGCNSEKAACNKKCAPGGSDEDCVAVCNTDGNEGYYWAGDRVETVACQTSEVCGIEKDSHDEPSVVCIPLDTGKSCTSESTEKCDSACNADKSEGYYWNSLNNDVSVRKCENSDCVLIGSSVRCKSDVCSGETVSTGGAVGNCCDINTYQSTCTDGHAHALVCWMGAVAQWTCANNSCRPDATASNKIYCEKPVFDSCTAESAQRCNSSCNPDKSEGYYWNATAGVVGKKKCVNNDCVLNGSIVACASELCDGQAVKTGGKVGDCCIAAEYRQTCTDANAHALVCWNNVVTQWDCANDGCRQNSENPDKVICEKPTYDACTAASTERCKPACSIDKSEGYYWSASQNALTVLKCDNNDCIFEGSGVKCKSES